MQEHGKLLTFKTGIRMMRGFLIRVADIPAAGFWSVLFPGYVPCCNGGFLSLKGMDYIPFHPKRLREEFNTELIIYHAHYYDVDCKLLLEKMWKMSYSAILISNTERQVVVGETCHMALLRRV